MRVLTIERREVAIRDDCDNLNLASFPSRIALFNVSEIGSRLIVIFRDTCDLIQISIRFVNTNFYCITYTRLNNYDIIYYVNFHEIEE